MRIPKSFAEFSTRFSDLYAPPLAARSTWKKHQQVLRDFATVAGVESLEQLDTESICRYVAKRARWNPNTIRSHLRTLKTASLYAVERGWLPDPPIWRRLMPREGPRLAVRHLDQGQVVTLLDQLQADRTWHGRRLHALVSTVAYTGLRRLEVLRAETADLDLSRGVLWVSARHRLKTVGSAAPVPIPPELVPILADWLPESRCQWVFPGARRVGPWTGGSWRYKPDDQLRAAGERAGIPRLGFHALRHTLGKLMVGSFGCTLDQARAVLRHDDARTTAEYYLHPDDLAVLQTIGKRISFRDRGQAAD